MGVGIGEADYMRFAMAEMRAAQILIILLCEKMPCHMFMDVHMRS